MKECLRLLVTAEENLIFSEGLQSYRNFVGNFPQIDKSVPINIHMAFTIINCEAERNFLKL